MFCERKQGNQTMLSVTKRRTDVPFALCLLLYGSPAQIRPGYLFTQRQSSSERMFAIPLKASGRRKASRDERTSFILQRIQPLSSLRHFRDIFPHDPHSVVDLSLDSSRLCVSTAAWSAGRIRRGAIAGNVGVVGFRPDYQRAIQDEHVNEEA